MPTATLTAPKPLDVIKLARRYAGTKENPANSNRQMFGAWYGANGVYWCAEFISFVLYTAGFRFKGADTAKGWAYCPNIGNYFKKRGLLGHTPRVGALVLFWNGSRFHHVELVTKVGKGGAFTSIGGNTGPANLSNGGEVLEHDHTVHNGDMFCYLPYAADDPHKAVSNPHPAPAPKSKPAAWNHQYALSSPMVSGPDVARASAALGRQGFNCGKPANVFGPQMDKAVRAYQRHIGLTPDGILGPVTAAHLGL